MNNIYQNRIELLASTLASGKYKKTNTGFMCIDGTFDIYGVMCEVYKEITDIGCWEKKDGTKCLFFKVLNREEYLMPQDDIMLFFGLSTLGQYFNDGASWHHLPFQETATRLRAGDVKFKLTE